MQEEACDAAPHKACRPMAKVSEPPAPSAAVRAYRATFAVLQRTLQLGALWAGWRALVTLQHAVGAQSLQALPQQLAAYHVQLPVVIIAAALLILWWLQRCWQAARQRTLLLDFAVYCCPEDCQVTWERFYRGLHDYKLFTQESIDFQKRISERNGLGDMTSLPPAMHEVPPATNMGTAREEAAMVLYGAVQEALRKTGLQPRQIDILIVNCSLFNPTPSLSAMIINHFGMRPDILSYNLAGMGCSASVIAVGLAQRLLAQEPDRYALVVSTENITQNWYHGGDRSMQIPNTLFRMGGAAIVLTNKLQLTRRAKYELEQVVRVHMGADDEAYNCVFQQPDSDGVLGVSLSRDLPKIAGRALKRNLTALGPLVLPWSEKLLFAANWVARQGAALCGRPGAVEVYQPDFRQAFQHFCLHAGGRAVVEGLGTQLGLTPRQVAPSSAALYHFGNTSSSSIWYSLAYIEHAQSIASGDRVWQVGFGSGFKCNSAVWRARRPLRCKHAAWEGKDLPTNGQQLQPTNGSHPHRNGFAKTQNGHYVHVSADSHGPTMNSNVHAMGNGGAAFN